MSLKVESTRNLATYATKLPSKSTKKRLLCMTIGHIVQKREKNFWNSTWKCVTIARGKFGIVGLQNFREKLVKRKGGNFPTFEKLYIIVDFNFWH